MPKKLNHIIQESLILLSQSIEKYFQDDTFDPNNDVNNKGDIIFVGDTLETDIKLRRKLSLKVFLFFQEIQKRKI